LPAREPAEDPLLPPALELVPAFELSGEDVPEHALKFTRKDSALTVTISSSKCPKPTEDECVMLLRGK
jgi:hypothetical protein